MGIVKILLLLFISISIYAKPIVISDKNHFLDLLSHSQIFIDESKSLNFSSIKKLSAFQDNSEKLLAFGYSPNFNVWIKFTLKNESDRSIQKIIEYANSLTTDIEFYNSKTDNVTYAGLYHINSDRKTINPSFIVQLKPQESVTYYIKASSHITSLIIKLHIWDMNNFYTKEIKHQFFLALFFGAMFVISIYNLFIYFFTKDISYLYYVLYIFGMITHHLLYVGIAQISILNQYFTSIMVQFASIIVAFPIFFLGLFTKTFLQTNQYPKSNKILNFLLVLIPITLILFSTSDFFNKYRNIATIALLVYLIYLTIYATLKKNRQAYFILFGWFLILIAGIIMFLSSTGILNMHLNFPYIVEIAFVLEAVVLSIALADRINQLQIDKQEANQQLITQQENEKQRLETQVQNKTSDLKIALDEKGLLLKELNHRVKNNMQMIVSLINLQTDSLEDKKTQEVFNTAQNRIKAMSHLHELLYKQDNVSNINAYDYFSILIEELKYSYENNININYSIETQLPMEQAVYCGIIVNELVSNSFKYAFNQKVGNVSISLKKENHLHQLCVSDDGMGYKKKEACNSLGLILVETLALKQLKATIETSSLKGVKVVITWDASQKLELF